MQYLYRHFDANSRLLYVGITDNVEKRKAQHKKTSPWWPLVTNITVKRFYTRKAVLKAEFRAIALENPIHNYGAAHTHRSTALLLKLLRERKELSEIAKEMGISKSAVCLRIGKLVRCGLRWRKRVPPTL